MAEDRVEIPVDITVDKIDTSKVSKSSMAKDLKKVVDPIQDILNKATNMKSKDIFGALKGKTSVAKIQRDIVRLTDGIKTMEKERDSAADNAKNYYEKMGKLEKKNEQSKVAAKKKLQQMEETEKQFPAMLKSAKMKYMSAKSAAVRNTDPDRKAFLESNLEYAKLHYEGMKRRMSPKGQAEWQASKNQLAQQAEQGKYAGEIEAARAKQEKFNKSAAYFNRQIEKRNKAIKNLTFLKSVSKVGTAMSSVFGKKNKEVSGFSKRFGGGLKKAAKNIMLFGLGFRSLYYLVKSLRKLIIQDLALIGRKFQEVNGPLSEVLTLFNQLKGAVGTMIQPIISAVLPALKQLMQYLSQAAEQVGTFFAVLTGQNYIYKAKSNQKDFAASILGTKKLADYDELKVIDGNHDTDYEKQAVSMDSLSEKGQQLVTLFQTMGTELKDMFAQLGPEFIDTLNALFPIITTLIQEVIIPSLPTITKLLTFVLQIIQDIAPVITKLLQGIMPIIIKLVEKLLPVFEKILKALEPVFNVIIDSVLPFLIQLLESLMPLIDGILDFVIAILEPILALIAPLLDLIITILTPLLDILKPIFELLGFLFSTLGKLLSPILQLIAPLLELLTKILKPIMDILSKVISFVMEKVVYAIEYITGILQGLISGVLNVFKDAITGLSDSFESAKKVFIEAWEKIKTVFENVWEKIKSIINWILGGIEDMVNGVVSAINWMIDAVNKLSFDWPDWLGGGHFGFAIPHIQNVKIPRLAQGAVLPPNREFLASLGDQSHGVNVEAPLDVIKKALVEAMQESGGAHEPVILQLDGTTIAKVVWSQNEKRYKQTGSYAY